MEEGRRRLALATVLLVALSGCGSNSSYTDGARSSVSNLRSIIATYDGVNTGSLASTGVACNIAASKFRARSSAFRSGVPSQYRTVSYALAHGVSAARAGFSDCADAARTLNYPLMMKATQELQVANGWMAAAAKSDK